MALYSQEENNAVFHKQWNILALETVVAGTLPSEQNPTERSHVLCQGQRGSLKLLADDG